MYGNGVGIGTIPDITKKAQRKIRKVLNRVRSVYCVAARGAAALLTAVRLIAAAASPTAAATTTVFAWRVPYSLQTEIHSVLS